MEESRRWLIAPDLIATESFRMLHETLENVA